MFTSLLQREYIYRSSMSQPYCPNDQRFLPDRYVEGTCPYCKSPGARGDQCEVCGKPLNAAELIEPRCRICGATPEFRPTEHFFLKLSAFQDQLKAWIQKQAHWRPSVKNFSLGVLEEGLKDRAITRDIDWGITVPVPGFESKRIYVWFEAVTGYLSAAKQWAMDSKQPERWHDFWDEASDVKSYYFIGKDNIPFHTLIWPAMLMGYGGLKRPYDVPANEFLTFESRKGSKSHNWAVWAPDFLARYDPDPLRYVLSINMPETSDTDFSWREFVRRNNDELVATYGNLVNRVLTFTYRNFEGKVPVPGGLTEDDREIQKKAQNTLAEVDSYLAECKFKLAILRAMELAQAANRYLDNKAPWKTIKTDPGAAANSLYVALTVIIQLRTMLFPFMPFSSRKVHEYLGFSGDIARGRWQWQDLSPGQTLRQPQPLFKKLEESVIEEEMKRLGA